MAVFDLLDENEIEPDDIGTTLRNAREAAGFSIADVADRMRLGRQHIENLEAERFDLFPVSVFLRGYLTSYARLLGIDAEPLLEAYDRRGFGPPQLHSQTTAQATPRGSEFTVTITTLIVIAVLIVLSALWWRDQWTESGGLPTLGTATEQPDGLPDEGSFSPGLEGDLGEPAGPSTVPELTGDPGEPAGRGGEADSPEDSNLPVSPGTEPAAGDGDPGAAAPAQSARAPGADSGESATPGQGSGSGEAAEPAPRPAETAASIPAGDAQATAAGAPASIVIRVREDCWLMIRDADQRLVYRDIAAAGAILELSAVPPIRIVAGYARGIDVEYNGEPVDLSPYIEQDTGTARFRLGS